MPSLTWASFEPHLEAKEGGGGLRPELTKKQFRNLNTRTDGEWRRGRSKATSSKPAEMCLLMKPNQQIALSVCDPDSKGRVSQF